MILHSIVPLDAVFPPQADAAPLEERQVAGATLLGRRTAQGFVVSQVISTDPAAYLSGAYAPGKLLPPGAC